MTVNQITADYSEEIVQSGAAESKQQRIRAQFSPIDGSHRSLKNYIKHEMNDPSSFQHVKTTYSEYDDYLLVRTSFRGKNGFNATVLDVITAKVDLDGNIIEIVDR